MTQTITVAMIRENTTYSTCDPDNQVDETLPTPLARVVTKAFQRLGNAPAAPKPYLALLTGSHTSSSERVSYK